jgi:hypothetical protein
MPEYVPDYTQILPGIKKYSMLIRIGMTRAITMTEHPDHLVGNYPVY